MKMRGNFSCRMAGCLVRVNNGENEVPHEYEAERKTKGMMSARNRRAVRSVGSSVQQSNQEQVAKGRDPARAEEDRGTGQGTSGKRNRADGVFYGRPV